MSTRKDGPLSVTPWRDWAEWQQVHAALFSEDPFAQQRAISRVAAWRSRAQLPVAINATAQLAELQLHEQLAEGHHHAVGVSSRSHMELSLLYASVVVRCVNGLVDGSQTGAYAMAVSALAQRIGIPLWIVDLRHESTHNQLPSLPVLRFASQHLLAWLRANYWRKQEDEIRGLVHQTAAWLLARPPLATMTPANQEDQADSSLAGSVNPDSVRSVAVPLLVFGEQFGERVAPTGLLFLPKLDADGQPLDEDGAAVESFAGMLLELQAQWLHFSAWLMACVSKKVFRSLPLRPETKGDEDGEAKEADAPLEDARVVTRALQWVKFLLGKPWRERLKPAAVDSIYSCGAEMLLVGRLRTARRRGRAAKKLPGGAALDQLISFLSSIASIREHPVIVTGAAISEALVAPVSETGWRELPGWTACPLGLRHSYNADWLDDSELVEYSLDDDSVPPPEGTAFVAADASDAVDEAAEEMLKESDEEYEVALQQIAELHEKIGKEQRVNTFSAASGVIPTQELQRIQDEIEIW